MLNVEIKKRYGMPERKPQQIRARVTDADYSRICNAAKRNDMCMADYVRVATMRLLEQDERNQEGR